MTGRRRHPATRWPRCAPRGAAWLGLAVLAVWLAVSPSWAAAVESPRLLTVEWQVASHPGDPTDWQGLARALLHLSPGDALTQDALAGAEKRLQADGRLGGVRLQVEPLASGAVLHVRLAPYPRIKDIRIQGAYPLFTSDIHRRMRLTVGAPLVAGALEADRASILDLLQEQGFVAPAADLRAATDPQDGFVVLHVALTTGRVFRLADVAFSGIRSFSARRLTPGLRIWRASLWPGRGGRFRTEDLRADVADLVAFYRKEGFPEADVEADADQDGPSGTVRVVFRVREGPRYIITFDGNRHFADRCLADDLVIFTEGNPAGDRGLRRSVRRIRERYREAGYLDTRVDVRERLPEPGEPPGRRLVLEIVEGPRALVSAVEIAGAQALPPETLRRQMLLREGDPFHPQTLEDDRNAVQAFYWQEGFPDVQVDSETAFSDDRRAVRVRLAVDEGAQLTVEAVDFSGLSVVTAAQAMEAIHLRPGQSFQRFMLSRDESALTALVAAQGHPHARVAAARLPGAHPSGVRLHFQVQEGPRVQVGEIHYSGHRRTRETVLRREMELAPGDPFNLAQVLEAERRLHGTDLFTAVRVRPLGLQDGLPAVPLLTEVVERPPYLYELEGGLQSDAGFFVRTKLVDRNLGGLGKTAWVGGELSQIGYRAETGLTDPRLFGTRLTASLNLFAEERDEFNQEFRTTSYGVAGGLARQWGARWTGSLNLRLERREQTGTNRTPEEDDLTAEELAALEEPRYLAVLTPGVRYDSRDSFIRPTRGLLGALTVDISQDLEDSRDDFLKYRGELRGYWTPWRRLTLAGIGRLGYLDPFRSPDDIPDDQLFYLGGLADVRGFGENLLRFDASGDPVGGRQSLSGSLEARIDVSDPFALTLFLDAGRIDQAPSGQGSDDWRASSGLGIHYQTPIGPVGLVYGWKLDRRRGEDAGALHFSIGYTF
jgi:outer membrane protein insertion porin family